MGASNTYNGATIINGGTLSIVNLSSGNVSSGLGKSSNLAGNLILNGGTLQFTGANSGTNGTTDRLFTLGTNGGTLDASGSVAVNFSNAGSSIAFSSIGSNEALALTGTNTGSNTLATTIADNGSGLTSLAKNGTGTWVLTGANAYTGGTTVNSGTLTLNGSGSVGSGGLAVNNANTGAGTGVVINFNSSQSVSSLSSTVATASAGTNTAQINIASGNTLTDTQGSTTTYAGSISGGTLNINGQGTGSSALVNYTGSDTAAQTNVGANATLQLNNSSGPALSGPVAVATGGALTINPNGTSNEIATAAPPTASPTVAAVTLNGGTLNANGSDGAVGDPAHLATTAVTQSMGALSLGGSGTLANPSLLSLGAGTAASPLILAFADSSRTLGSGYLNVTGYTGTTNALYVGTTSGGLTQSQLGQIAFNGMYGAFSQLGNGELVLAAAPEPGGAAAPLLGAGALAGLVFLRRRQAAKAA